MPVADGGFEPVLADLVICCGIMKMSSQHFLPDHRYQTSHPK